MTYLTFKRWLAALSIAVCLAWTGSAYATTPPHWKDSGFSINATGMSLRDMLAEFGAAYGVRVAVSVKDKGVLKGRLKADSGAEFLDRLMHTHDFRWFVYSGTLYIVPRGDNASVRLEVGEDAVQDAKSALIGVGLFDPRFGWGELPDEGIILINGPREYVNLAREILMPETKKTTSRGRQIMVFRLKYASASDRTITTRGQKETIPGIKTILTGLISGEMGERNGASTDKFDVGSEKRSREVKNGRGSAREIGNGSGPRTAIGRLQGEQDDAEESGRKSKSKPPSREERPRIDADTTLNAIIIYDSSSKREMYQTLIAELDVEPQQIEIEALIVDIERSKLADMGVEWGVRSGNTVARFNSTNGESRGVELPLPGSTMLISNAARFYARLKAMESSGEARVLAKPTVLTLDNVAAVLDLSQTSYVPLVGERVADLANVTAGTMLRVVPRVVREGNVSRVRLEVDIEDGALGEPGLKTNVTRSSISTQAIIDLQQTLMIGGYHSESVTKNQQKIPVLGDIPLFGGLFRTNTDSSINRERLFLITPRLIGTTGVVAAAQSKAARLAEAIAIGNAERATERSREAPRRVSPVATPPAATTPLAPGASAPGLPDASAPQLRAASAAPAYISVATASPPSNPASNADSSYSPTLGVPRRLKCVKPRIGFPSVGASRI